MSGRFKGNSKRWNNKKHGPKKNSGKPDVKKSLTDYNYYLGSAKQASDYETTTSFILNTILKEYEYGNDIATALEEFVDADTNKWIPALQISSSEDKNQKALENRQYEMLYKAELDEYQRRKRAYVNNKTKAYGLLWERCTKGMQNKIEARTDYESKIKKNPVELLRAIKEHSLNFQETRYDMSIIYDSFRTFFGCKQKEGESLQDYTKRFRVAYEVLESHLGSPIYLANPTMKMPNYNGNNAESCDKCIKETSDRFLAYAYLAMADTSKYGTLMATLNTQNSLGNQQYPKTITEANTVLSNHKFDNVKSQNDRKGKDNKNNEKNNDSSKGSDNQKSDDDVNLSFAQLEGKCWCCGKAGHKSPVCRQKDKIPKEKWFVNQVKDQEQSHAQASKDTDQQESRSNEESQNSSGWSGAHIQFYQAETMREWILLDNQSSTTVFCNRDLVEKVYDVEVPMYLETNGGVLITTQKAILKDWGEVWFNERAITNIFSYADMAKRYRITYDSKHKDAFVVH